MGSSGNTIIAAGHVKFSFSHRPILLLLRLGQSCRESGATHRFPKLQEKVPCMFSLNSLAYWTSSSTTYLANAACLANRC